MKANKKCSLIPQKKCFYSIKMTYLKTQVISFFPVQAPIEKRTARFGHPIILTVSQQTPIRGQSEKMVVC